MIVKFRIKNNSLSIELFLGLVIKNFIFIRLGIIYIYVLKFLLIGEIQSLFNVIAHLVFLEGLILSGSNF